MEHRGMLRPTRTSLSTVGKRCSEDKTLCLHITPPLTKPVVVGSWPLHRTFCLKSLVNEVIQFVKVTIQCRT